MKLLGITFKVLYFLLYIFLPCAIDVKCDESDAILNIWSFDLLNDDVPSYDEHKYNGINMYHRFHCDKSNFRFFLKRVVKETKKLKNKNKDDIGGGVRIDRRGKTFNKRVLVVNRDQIEIVLEEFSDILGCQECPTILFCDICNKNNIKNNIINNDKNIQEKEKIDALREEKDNSKSDSLLNENFNIKDKKKDSSGAKDKITDYNALVKFCSKYLKNGKTKVDVEQINEQKLKFGKSSLSEIFDNDKKNFGIITEYYSNNNYEGKIIKKLFELKGEIINDIRTADNKGENINDIESADNKGEFINDIRTADNKGENINDIKKAADNPKNIISKNNMGHDVVNFKALCEKYQQAESDILLLGPKNINSLPGILKHYIRWRKILLQAQIIRTFIYFLGKEDIVKKNKGTIKERIKLKYIPNYFKNNYTEYFFSDDFRDADYNNLKESIKNEVGSLIGVFGDISYDSFLDLFWIYSKYKNIISLANIKILKRLDDFLKNLKKGTLFTEKKSVLFKIVEIAASNGTDFDKEVFYKLDKQIKNHFNSIIFRYLTDLLGRVKKKMEDAGGKGTTYDFHNANKVIEIIRVISSYINPVLQKKEGRPELICNAIILLMKEMKDLSLPADINGILMECSLVLNTLIEYFIYVKDFNDYVSKRSEEKQFALKKDAISNKLDSFCIIREEDYSSLGSLDTSAPGIIKTVARRLYECIEDEGRNDPFFKIVVMGDMRAGKTSLIRNLFDEAERLKFKVANGDTSTTSEVMSHTRTYNDIEKYIQITDTPGFEGIGKEDRGYEEIYKKFNGLFKGDDTVVLDIVLFREGCINWLSENHEKIITRVLKETGNKIIFLIPFTSLKKNAKKIKEKFLASLFYNLYIKGKDFPVKEEELKENYKKFVERVIAIPINQLYSEESNESRFGLIEMGETVKQCLSENKKDDNFYKSFINSLPKDELCKEEERIKEEKEDIVFEEEIKQEEAIDERNPEDKTELIQSEALPEIDEKYSWYHDDKKSYKLLNYIYLLYLGTSFFINQLCTKIYDPLLYEIYKTEIYRLAEFITSPYFFNYLCLDNEKLKYNIFFFKEEIDILNRKEELEEGILKKKKLLAQFCLVADDPFLISEDDYKSIQELCAKFNENYNNFNPLSSVENAMETNYKQIKNKLDNYFEGKEESIGEIYLNFVVCYDTTQQRYIIDRTNLCFLGINLNRDENKLYEKIPESLKDYIKDLNEAIKGKSYNDFEKTIKDENKKCILYRRYHHPDRKQLIRKIELNRIREEEERKKKEEEDKRRRNEEERIKKEKEERIKKEEEERIKKEEEDRIRKEEEEDDEEEKEEEEDEKEAEEKNEKEKLGSLKHLILETLIGFNNFKLKEPKEERRKMEIEEKKDDKKDEKKEEIKIEEEKEQEEKEEELVIDEEKEDRTIDEIQGDEIIEDKKKGGLFGNIFSGFKKFKKLFFYPPSDESPFNNEMKKVIEDAKKTYDSNKVKKYK